MTPEEINKINAQKLKNNKRQKKITQYCYQCKRAREVVFGEIHCPICKSPLGQFSPTTQNPETTSFQPKCPVCGSVNIQKISELRRGTHALAWGILSNTARSQFECKNCGYKF